MENYEVLATFILLACSISLYNTASSIRGILTIFLPPQEEDREAIGIARICLFLSIVSGLASFSICNGMENYEAFSALFLLVYSINLYIAASKIRGILTIHLPPQQGDRGSIAFARMCLFLSIVSGLASFFICSSIAGIPTNHLVVSFGALFTGTHIVVHDLVFEN